MAIRLDKVFTSPLVRAKQTANLVVREMGLKVDIVDTQNLIVGADPLLLIEELNREPNSSNMLVVGHEPFLGKFVSLLVFGSPAGKLSLTKAGLACVEADQPIRPGVGTLRCLLTFKQMQIMH